MPILVEHPGVAPELEALVALLSAAQQPAPPPQPVPQQSQHPVDILAQLAALTGAKPNGAIDGDPSSLPAGYISTGHAPNPADAAINAAPSYQIRPHASQPHYPSYGNPNAVNGYDRLADEDFRAQFQAQQQQQLQAERAQQQNASIAMNQGDQMARWAQDVPPSVVQGINDGSLEYTPVQQRAMDADIDAINRVDNDPSWSPQQREALKSQRWMHFKHIHSAPSPVPINKRQVTPQQQFEQSVVTYTDPDTGKKIQGFMGMRGGVSQFMPFKPQADPLDLEHIKQQNKIEIEKIKADAKAAAEAAKPLPETPAEKLALAGKKAQLDSNLKLLEIRIKHQLDLREVADNDLQAAQADLAAGKGSEADVSAKREKLRRLDEAYAALATQHNGLAQAAAQADLPPSLDRLTGKAPDGSSQPDSIDLMLAQAARLSGPVGPPPDQNDMMAADYAAMQGGDWPQQDTGDAPPTPQVDPTAGAQQAPATDGPPQWYLALPSGATYTAPDGSQRVKSASGAFNNAPPSPSAQVASPDELRQRIQAGQLHEGDIVMTPRGPRPLTAEVIAKLMGGQ